jgi:hypothetical protein
MLCFGFRGLRPTMLGTFLATYLLMKIIKIWMYGCIVIASPLLAGCADSGNSAGNQPAAGAGTSGTAEAPGGPGHGPNNAMNGNTP